MHDCKTKNLKIQYFKEFKIENAKADCVLKKTGDKKQ